MRQILVLCLVVFFSAGVVFAVEDVDEKKVSLWGGDQDKN